MDNISKMLFCVSELNKQKLNSNVEINDHKSQIVKFGRGKQAFMTSRHVLIVLYCLEILITILKKF